jgi:hypothetical protein
MDSIRLGVLRRAKWASAGLAVLAGFMLVGLLGASPATASTCRTQGHAYLTQPGWVIFSGYEGNQVLGVPTLTYIQGTRYFNVGGNGIMPGTPIVFNVYNRDNGSFVTGLQTARAHSNCVVNEQGTSMFTFLGPGHYQVQASYTSGYTGRYIASDVVTNIDVQPSPFPPPDTGGGSSCPPGVNPDAC